MSEGVETLSTVRWSSHTMKAITPSSGAGLRAGSGSHGGIRISLPVSVGVSNVTLFSVSCPVRVSALEARL